MPKKELMSWNKTQRRWEKMHKGKRVFVTVTDLGFERDTPNVREASYQKANEWWQNRLTGLIQEQAAEHPHADILTTLEAKHEYAKRHGHTEEAESLASTIEQVRAVPADEHHTARALTQDSTAAAAIWDYRWKNDKKPATNRTLQFHVDKYVSERQSEAIQGIHSHEHADFVRRALVHFTEFAGKTTPLDAITYDLWHRWYVHCKAQIEKHDKNEGGWSADSASKFFITVRAFVSELAERDVLHNPPKNLRSEKYKFARPVKDIPYFTKEEARRLFTEAKGIHRLIFILMANTGATQKDIADLKREEIDLEEGRITRRRSKMRKKESSRLVSYKLWPETLELLRKHMKEEGELALTTKSGQPWVWTETDTEKGKIKKSDNVATIYNRIRHRLKIGKPVKVFRKTSATFLMDSKEHRHLRQWFLGHKEADVSDSHYAAKTQEQLDAAVDWLRTQYDIPE